MTNKTPIPDYSSLIDVQTHAFIQRSAAAFPENAATLDIKQQRALYDAMCREFHAGYPSGIVSTDTLIADVESWQIPVRQYTQYSSSNTPFKVQIIYLHGGGFVVGSLESHDDVCAEICDRTSAPVTSVDYRLSPEHKHPAALNDTMQVIDYLHHNHPQPIVLCGDSAGANLCAAACHAYRDRGNTEQALPDIIGQVLIYPGLGGDIEHGSYVTHAHSPMLSTEDVHFYSNVRCDEDMNARDPLLAPLLDSEFSQLPPTVVFGAECDPLCDDGERYCQHIAGAGGKAHWVKERGLVHGYLRARHSVDRAAMSFNRIVDAINSLADRRWPYPP
ncbi:MAG: alpha/beta hydrolase [Granulosicoccus sp.]